MVTFSFFLLVFLAITSAIITAIITYKTLKTSSSRNHSLWYLFFINGLFFLMGLLIIAFLDPQRKLTLLTYLVFNLIVSFSLAIELPGWYKLTRFDENTSEELVKVRTILIKIRYSYEESLAKLKEMLVSKKTILKDEKLDALIEDFIKGCENMEEQLNPALWSLTLSEVTDRINDVNKRSKHPIPKLIDILALSGLSILIAELIQLIG